MITLLMLKELFILHLEELNLILKKKMRIKKFFFKKIVPITFELSKYFVVDYPNMAHHYEF